MIDICKDKLWTYSLRNNVIMYENMKNQTNPLKIVLSFNTANFISYNLMRQKPPMHLKNPKNPQTDTCIRNNDIWICR